MKMSFRFSGKKGIAPALLAAALAISLLFGCSSGGDDGLEEIPSQGTNQGGAQTGTFTVTFNANAPQGTQVTGTMAAQTFTQGQPLTLAANAFSIDGYAFKGWAESSSATERKYADGQKITVSADITLYAVWESEKQGEDDIPTLEDVYEIDSLVLTNENLSPKQVSDILESLRFDYTITTPGTDYSYPQNYIFYENLPEKIKADLHFKEITENGGVERDKEYQFSEVKKEISFEILHGEKSKLKKTLKNGNYDYSKVLQIIRGFLKEIIGEAEYDAISPNAKSGNLTLTAESVKAVYDFFPTLEKYAEAGKTANDVEDTSIILQNKEAFVAQAEGEVEIKLGPIYPDWYEIYPEHFNEETAEKMFTIRYKKNFAFEGVFNLDEIQFEKVDGAQGNFDDATLTNNGTSISIYELNQIRGDSLPILIFTNIAPYDNPYITISESYHILKLYMDYDGDNLYRLQFNGDESDVVIDGSK